MLARIVIVALLATMISGLPTTYLLTGDAAANQVLTSGMRYMRLALFGNIFIGLPVALVVYYNVRALPKFGLVKLVIFANSVVGAFVAIMSAIGGNFAFVFLGLPVLLAANAFAFFGWFLVLKPTKIEV